MQNWYPTIQRAFRKEKSFTGNFNNLLRRANPFPDGGGLKTCILSALVFASAIAFAQGSNKSKYTDAQIQQLTSSDNNAISFIENKGQWPAHILYRADVPGGQMLATTQGMLIAVIDRSSTKACSEYGMKVEQIQSGHMAGMKIEDLGPAPVIKGFGWRLNFAGANLATAASIQTEGESKEYFNYLNSDRSASATGAHSYSVITYKDVYKDINVKYYTSGNGNLENDIIVKPGADAGQISLQIEGIDELKMDTGGGLILPTTLGNMAIASPVSYLLDASGNRSEIKLEYRLTGKNQVTFDIPDYDKSKTLIIDPIVMRWATWIASSTNVAAHCHAVDLDSADNIYVVARGGNGFVASTGEFQTTYDGTGGSDNLWITKWQEPAHPGGPGTRVWATYLGGTATTNPYACNVGPDGYLYIAGETNDNLATAYGTGYPTVGWTQRAIVGGGGGQQCFVAKFAPSGAWAEVRDIGTVSANLSPSLYDIRILPTGAGNFDLIATGYVTEQTTGVADGDVPEAEYPNGTFVTTGGGHTNGYIFRLSSDLNTLKWEKQYTSNGTTNEFFISPVEASGNILIGGTTNGTADITYNNPSTQTTRTGNQDGWLMSLDSATGAANWSRYFNGASGKTTTILCMELNQQQTSFVIGGMTSGLAAGNISAGSYQTTYPGGTTADFYIASLPVAANTTTWGTYFGGNASNTSDNMMGLNIDGQNNVYVLGYTNSKFVPTTIPADCNPVQTDTYDPTNYDAVFFKLSGATGDSLLYFTYLGGTGDEEDPVGERGIKFYNCRIYLAITSESDNFPLTSGTYDSVATNGTYLPIIVSMANPPDLDNNNITSGANQTIACGNTPQLITANTPVYVIPEIIRDGVAQTDSTSGAYPDGVPTIGTNSFEWQYSTNGGITWAIVPGANGQNYAPPAIDSFTGTILYARIINGDYCLTGDTTGVTEAIATVNVTPAYASPPITSNSPICGGQTLDLSTPADSGFSYHWSGPAGFTSSAQDTAINNIGQANTGEYYLYEVNNGNGCPSYSDSTNVVIGGVLPPPTASSNSPVCAGDTLLLSASGAGTTFTWTGPNGFTSSGQNLVIPNVQGIDSGWYYVTQSNGGSCISPPDSIYVIINTIPKLAAFSNTPVCSGDTLDLFTSIIPNATYSWTGPNGFTSNDQDPVIPNATTADSGVYMVTATLNGCSSNASTDVTVLPVPPAPVAGNNGPLCEGSTLNLTAGNIAGATYTWIGPNGFISNLQNPTINNVTVADSGVYSVVANINGCITDTGTTDVVINPTPDTPVVGSNSPVCTDSTLNLFAVGSQTGGSYSWSGPNNFTSTQQDPSIPNATSAASGTYTLVFTSNAGCSSAPASTTVIVNTTPVPVATSNSPICAGSTLDLFVTSFNGASYFWTGPNGFTSNLQNPTIPNVTLQDTGVYSVLMTANGCVSNAAASVDVVIYNTTPPVASNNGPLCSGATLDLFATTVANATYTWTGPGGFTSNLQNPTIQNTTTANAGTYSVIANVSGCNSSSPATTLVVINPTPTITAGNNSPLCTGSTLQLTVSTFAGATYTWTGPNGFNTNTQDPSIPNVTFADSGVYTVTASAAGCSNTTPATTDVIINAVPPTPVISTNSPLCVGQTLNLVVTGANPNATYSWEGPDGFTSSAADTSIDSVTLLSAGVYTVTATINGCSSQPGTANVVVHPIPASPTVGSNSPLCDGDTLRLTSTTNSGSSFSWSGPNNFTSTDQNPVIPGVTQADSGVYTVAETIAGCTSPSASTLVIINVIPPAPIASSNSPVCFGDTLFLYASYIPGATYLWTDTVGFTSNLQNPYIPNVTYAAASTYKVVDTVNGCVSAPAFVTVVIGMPPIASFTSNAPQCEGQPVSFDNTGSTGAGITYSWNFGQNATPDTSTEENPTGIIFSTIGSQRIVLTVNNGVCTSVDTQYITITGAPIANFVNNGPACFPPGQVTFTDSSTGNVTSWFWNFGANATPATSTSQGPITVTYSSPGTVYVTLTVSGGGCSSTTTERIDVGVIGANFTSSVPMNGDNGCLGQPVNFYSIGSVGSSAQNYWNFGQDAVPDTSTATNPAGIIYTTTGAKIVTHIVYDNTCGLADTVVHIITINPIPTSSFTSTAPVCANTPVNFTNTGSTGVNYTFFWDFGSGANPSTSTSEDPIDVQYNFSGLKVVTFSITNGFYCTVTDTADIVINSTPVASFSTNAPVCTGLPVQFTNTGTLTNTNWNWSFDNNANPTTSTDENPVGVTYAVPGIQTVTLIATDNTSGCADTATQNITINQTPNASFTSNAPQCSNQAFNFTNTGSSGGQWSYTWNFGTDANPITSSAEDPSGVLYGSGGTKTVTLTISGEGCTNTTSATIVVDSTPTASFGTTAPQCTGIGVDFSNTGTATGVTYLWNFGANANPATSTDQNPTGVTYDTAGTKTVTLTVTNAVSGCSATASMNIVINQTPVAAFTSNAPQCSSVPIDFTDAGSTGGTWSYSWDFGVGANPAGSSAQNPSGIVYSSSGTKSISFTVSGGGCTQTTTQNIVISSTPTASFISNAPQCTGLPVNFSNTGTSAGVTWMWNFGAGATPDSSSLQNPDSIIYSLAGPTAVTLTITDTSSGCTATATTTYNIPQTPTASFTSNAPQCSTVPINFTNMGSTGSQWSYSWDLGAGAVPAFSSSQNPSGVMYTSAGSKTITFTISSQYCTQTSTQTIVINSTPTASFVSTAPQCTGLPVNFTNTGTATGVSYNWDFGGGSVPGSSSAQNPDSIIYSGAGTIPVTLTTTDTSSGCSVSVTNTITINQSPTASFTTNAPQCSTVPINFTNTGSTGAQWAYNWDFGLGADPAISSAQNPSGIVYSSSGTKVVTFTISNQNCTSTATQNIVINSTPSASFNSTAPQCTGLDVNFSNTGTSAGVSWSWSFGAGAVPSTSTLQNPDSIVYTTAGTQTVTLTITDTASGCSATATSAIIIHQTPTASFTSNAPQCSTVPINFTNTGSTGNNWYYSWDLGQGANPPVSSAEDPSGVTYSSSGAKIVTFTISDQNCTNTTSDTIIISPTPSASFLSTAPQCTGLPVNFTNTGTNTGVSWAWNFGTGATPATSTLQNPDSIIYSTAGTPTVSLTITDSGSGCSASASVAIQIHQTPTASFTSNAPQCSTVAINFTNTGSTGNNWSYTWDFGGGAVPSGSSNEFPGPVNYTTSGSKIVSLSISGGGCTQTTSDTIVILSTPTASFTSNTPKCSGLPVDFVNTGTSTGVSFAWNFGTGAAPPTSTSQYPSGVIYSLAGIIPVTLTITDSSSACAATATNNIIIYQTPTASFTSTAPQCAKTPVSFFNTGSTGNNWIYNWDFGQNSSPSFSSSPDPAGIVYDTAGSKIVTFTISDGNCAASVSDTINIGNTPAASFTSTAPQCSGLAVSFTNTGSSSGVSYAWNLGNGANPATSTAQNPTPVVYSTAGITTVTLTVTDTNSLCFASVTNTINIYPTPVASFTTTAPQCTNTAVNFANTGSTGGGWTYAWDFGQNATPASSSAQNPSGVLYDSSGTKVVTFTISSANCSQTATDTININSTPVASFTSTAPVCSGMPISFTNTGTGGGVEWTWNFGPNATPSSSTLQDPAGVVYSTYGTQTVTLTITDSATLCATTATNTINIFQTPVANFTSNAPQCANSPIDFSNSGTSGAGWTYNWDFGNNGAPEVSTSENPGGILYDSSGQKTVTFTISSANCSQTSTQTITISPLPFAFAGNDTIICANRNVMLGNDSVQNGATYVWFPSSTLTNPYVQNPVASPTASFTTYSVTVTAQSGCTNTGFVNVTMLNPLIANAGVAEQICLNDSVEIGAGLIEGQFYTWTPATGLSSTTSPNPVATPNQTTTYTLSVTDSAGCAPVTDQVTVTVNPLPTTFVTQYDTIASGGSVQLLGTGGVQYAWSPPTGLNSANIYDPVASPDSSTTYLVTVTNLFGCQSVDTVNITVYGYEVPYWIPTTFTPNGDGHNDVLYVRGTEFLSFDFEVYNRYGQMMFESKNVSTGWDGNMANGQQAPMDAYVWKLTGTLNSGQAVSAKGLVNLVR